MLQPGSSLIRYGYALPQVFCPFGLIDEGDREISARQAGPAPAISERLVAANPKDTGTPSVGEVLWWRYVSPGNVVDLAVKLERENLPDDLDLELPGQNNGR